MKTINLFSLISILFLGVETIYSETIVRETTPDQMAIHILPDDTAQFQIRTFADGIGSYLNRTYVWQSTPTDFSGFQFLCTNVASGAAGVYRGTIIPSSDGTIYIIGSSTTLSGWTLTGSTVYYSATTPTVQYIYSRTVTAGQSIAMPTNQLLTGFSPLAKTITVGPITGVEQVKKDKNFNVIFCNNELLFDFNNPTVFDLFIYDTMGRSILVKKNNKSSDKVRLDKLSNGVYLVNVETLNGNFTKKIVKN